jgi:fatty acid synthase, animal type
MMANRVSYCIGLTGPSLLLDTACSSSLCALDLACKAINDGQCEGAFVGGSNLLLSGGTTKIYGDVGFLAPDGYCRPFDNNASGYCKAEALTMIFLQKRKDARRVYATIVHTKSEYDGNKSEEFLHFSGEKPKNLMENFYRTIQIDPASVGYLEAHGSGQRNIDFVECEAVDAVFCKNRKKPLLIGSIKSNMGNAEPAAGVCSIIKAVLAFQTGQIAPNLHFTQCRQDVPSLVEGRLKVVAELTPLQGPLIAINSFGFTGHNAHCLLRMFDKEKVNKGLPQDNWPRLVVWSGRTEAGIHTMLDSITTRSIDVEQVALINQVHLDSTSGYVFRGFGLYEQQGADENAACLSKDVKHFSGVKRPLVFVFSGMGSQWCEMGTALMAFPIFRDSIQKCHKVLAQHGLDLINILTSPEKTTYDNILHSFVGIAAIQIGLVDILRVLEIKPDYIIGHSVGELGCAYADGSMTAEQMILAAYSRGMASVETKAIFGSMAAVGLGYRNIRKMLPAGIEVACHNSSHSCTISGPGDLVADFVIELKKKKIFAREVPCSNIPYHSKYIKEFGPNLLSRLRQVIPEPKERSAKWLSTSVPKHQWDQPESQLCSAEYHTNNLLSPVLFEETAALLPTNAILLEIAPHRLLQGILKQSMPEAVYIGLTQRSTKDITLLFNGIGQLYCQGYDSMINRLYPHIEYPVSRGTPMLSPHVRWDHGDDWYVADFETMMIKYNSYTQFTVENEVARQALKGHVIDGNITSIFSKKNNEIFRFFHQAAPSSLKRLICSTFGKRLRH